MHSVPLALIPCPFLIDNSIYLKALGSQTFLNIQKMIMAPIIHLTLKHLFEELQPSATYKKLT